jgi:hypothetical protein
MRVDIANSIGRRFARLGRRTDDGVVRSYGNCIIIQHEAIIRRFTAI